MSKVESCVEKLCDIFKKKTESFLSKTKDCSIKLGTLGDEGTTSSLAARYLQSTLNTENGTNIDIVYCDSFEGVHAKLVAKEIDYALVPNAYERATDYYWDDTLVPVFYFVYDTPKYGVYSRPDCMVQLEKILSKKDLRVAACPAVYKLISILLPQNQLENSQITQVFSTESAARHVHEKLCDLAVTNETSAKKYGLVSITDTYSIEMSWVVFSNK